MGVAAQQVRIEEKIDEVVTQTNGHYTKQLENIARLEEKVEALHAAALARAQEDKR
jgi:hypothetical protein